MECPNVATVDHWYIKTFLIFSFLANFFQQTYRYFKNERIDIENNKKFRLKNDGKILTIAIPDLDLEGEYKCEFKRKNHTLILITPPRIHLEEVENCRIDLKSVHAYEGKLDYILV